MKKMCGILGCLTLLILLSTPAMADDLGDKIAAWCGNASPGDTMALSDAESTTYDQHTSQGYNFSEGTRFEFQDSQGVCTITYTSDFGDEVLSSEDAVLHKSGNTLTMGKFIEK